MKCFHHNSNDYLLNSKTNITYDELIGYSYDEFLQWTKDLRKEVKDSWVKHNQPPIRTMDDRSIVNQMERLTDLDVGDTIQTDTMTNSDDLIVMKSPISCGSCFFPNMGKMKDINTTDMEGYSLWDYFVEGKNTKDYVGSMNRNFRRDSFYSYSPSLTFSNPMSLNVKDGKSWVKNFNSSKYRFWLDPIEKIPKGFLTINRSEIDELLKESSLTKNHFLSEDFEDEKYKDREQKFRIRLYEIGQRLFPKGFNHLRQGLVMMGVNFPPPISKFMYTHFTEDFKDQNEIIIYDPSMGYGGRLLGCLSVNMDRKIHYVGTDPNTENWIDELGISRYDLMGRFYNSNIKRKHQTTYETFMEGSEVVHLNKNFQKYKGKFDFIFTSPPYFGAEGYSEDETQSYKKFPTYEEWRDGFLTQTLTNCVEYLKPKRWICWNISDVQFNGKYYPLERDSVEIMKSLGMEYRMRFKMVLSGPISKKNIKERSRLPSTKNFCGFRGNFKKYEPIFCFFKP